MSISTDFFKLPSSWTRQKTVRPGLLPHRLSGTRTNKKRQKQQQQQQNLNPNNTYIEFLTYIVHKE